MTFLRQASSSVAACVCCGIASSRQYAIFLDSVALFEWAEDDRATRRLVVAQLVNAKLATRVEVARVFGLHVNTVSRIAQQVAAEGVTASVRHKRGPHGPFKVTPAVVAEFRHAVEEQTDGACRPAPPGATLEDQAVTAPGPPVMSRLKQEQAEQPVLALLPASRR